MSKLHFDTKDVLENKLDARRHFVVSLPLQRCVVLDEYHVSCEEMWPMLFCRGGNLPLNSSDAGDIWDACEQEWLDDIQFYSYVSIAFLIFFVVSLSSSALAGVLRVLFQKQKIWRKTYAEGHQKALMRLLAEWIERDEEVLCVAEKDASYADLQTLWFLCMAFFTVVLFPFALLYLPEYRRKKRDDCMNSVLVLSEERLLLKLDREHNHTVSFKFGAIKDLTVTADGIPCNRFFNTGFKSLRIKLNKAHVLRGMPSCDTLLLKGILNTEDFLKEWKKIQAARGSEDDDHYDGQSRDLQLRDVPLLDRFNRFASDTIEEASDSPSDLFESKFLHDARHSYHSDHDNRHSYWQEKGNGGAPVILCINVIPREVAKRRWNFQGDLEGKDTFLSLHLRSGATSWQVFRRPADFVELHLTLATKQRFRLGSLKDFPKLPKRMWPKLVARDTDDLDSIVLSTLNAYINECLQIPFIRNSDTFVQFLEVSSFSFRLAVKLREGYVWKRVDRSVKCGSPCSFCRTCLSIIPVRVFNCATCKVQWRKRWMVLREDRFLILENQRSANAKTVLMFDRSMVLKFGRADTGYEDGMIISTPDADYIMRCGKGHAVALWRDAILDTVQRSPFTQMQLYDSTFPPRRDCRADLLCDGGPYFKAVYEALENAEIDIYICDWWLTADLPLLRNGTEQEIEDSRIMNILYRRAEAGVKVFVHIYKEMPKFLYTDSAHAKTLLNVHENITVLRHPDHGLFSEGKMILLWSHHEKVVCIDQKVAFIGGIDLCLGRYDTDAHTLSGSCGQFPGKDYSNPVTKDFVDVKNMDLDLLCRDTQHRMPWHDISIRLQGPIVLDIARNFHQLWSHVQLDSDQKNKYKRKNEPHLYETYTESHERTSSMIAHARDGVDRLAKKGRKTFQRGLRVVQSWTHKMDDVDFFERGEQSTSIELPNTRSTESTRSTETRPSHGKDALAHPFTDGDTERGRRRWFKRQRRHRYRAFFGADEDRLQRDLENPVDEYDSASEDEDQDDSASEDQDNDKTKLSHSFPPNKSSLMRTLRNAQNNMAIPGPRASSGPFAPPPRSCTDEIGSDVDHKQDIARPRLLRRAVSCDHAAREVRRNRNRIRRAGYEKQEDSGGSDSSSSSDNHSPHHRELKRMCPELRAQSRAQRAANRARKPSNSESGTCTVQLLRTCSDWSYGSSEASVAEAYKQLITAAKSYVYIENQFFLTSTHRDSAQNKVQNKIGQVLVDRILQAAQQGAEFRVYIMLPACPGFEGRDLKCADAYNIRFIMNMQYESICRGANSVIETLRQELPLRGLNKEKWRDYIGFFCLKRAELMPNGLLHAEQIYIHSKVLIVDDDQMIIGSANINDRSLIIGRDSETCVIVSETELVKNARTRLWREHFGLLGGPDCPSNPDEIAKGLLNPSSIECWNLWEMHAKNNAKLLYDTLGYIPSSEIRTYDALRQTMARQAKGSVSENTEKVQKSGRVCEFPYSFLEKENMLTPAPIKASLAPYYLICT